jgi:methylmalonyl-CoA/ethylmalonyl-CoA epimerase
MIRGLDHIAIAVPDLEAAIRRFVDDFGLSLEGVEDVVAASTRTAFLPVNAAHIELVHPLDGGGAIRKFLDSRGGGLHHVCFVSDDVDADMARLRARGYRFTTDTPMPGAHGSRVAFVHPASADGLLIELAQLAGPLHGAGG